MRILLTGATGFIGSALLRTLQAQGHRLRLPVRDVRRARDCWPDLDVVHVEFSRCQLDDWTSLLGGIDAVINTVGIFSGRQSFEQVHVAGAGTLFEAAARAQVPRILHFSALGAAPNAPTEFLRSKYEAERLLARIHPHGCSIRPSLVFGAAGASAQLMLRLAWCGLLPLPAADARIQPIHVDDVCASVLALLSAPRMPTEIAAVGARCLRLREYIDILRAAEGLPRAHRAVLTPRWTQGLARIGDRWSRLPFDGDRLRMLEDGNCADVAPLAGLLGRTPRAPEQFLTRAEGKTIARALARESAGVLLRVSVAAVWLVSGFVSAFAWPVEDSLALLARCGLHGAPAYVALYGAAALDLLFGVATLLFRRSRAWLDAQLAAIAVYTVIVAMCLPEFLLHPFAPIAKNLCVAAAIWFLRGELRR